MQHLDAISYELRRKTLLHSMAERRGSGLIGSGSRSAGLGGAPSSGSDAPELVFALASPVGTPTDKVQQDLENGLHTYAYESQRIRLSTLLAEWASQAGTPTPVEPEHERVEALMDVGDQLCADLRSPAAVARYAVRTRSSITASDRDSCRIMVYGHQCRRGSVVEGEARGVAAASG